MKLTVKAIREIICEEFNVEEFIVDNRKEPSRMARHVFSFILYEFTILTWVQIGDIVGRSHSSVIHSHHMTRDVLMGDKKYGSATLECIKRCSNIIKAHINELKNEI